MTRNASSSQQLALFSEVPNAPKAVGPYSPAVAANGFLFLSGQVGLNPSSGTLVEGGVSEQAKQALQNLKSVLIHCGSSLDKVVKTTIFLSSMGDFQVVNQVYSEAMGSHRPARSTFAVAGLPLGALVEIEMIAVT